MRTLISRIQTSGLFRARSLFILLPLLTGCGYLFPSGPDALVIEHVSILPMTSDTMLVDKTIVIRGDSIQAITSASSATIPENSLVVEGKGKFLMPGMADMHARLPGSGTDSMEIPDWLFLYVAAGVTAINLTQSDSTVNRLKGKIEREVYTGPTLLSVELQNAPISAIDSQYIAFHLPDLDSAIRRPGVKFMPDHIVETWFEDYSLQFDASPAQLKSSEAQYDSLLVALKGMVDLYDTPLISPSSGRFITPGFAMIQEMMHWSRAGIDNYSILQAATTKAAKVLGESNEWGSIEVGKRADMILLSSNPLENLKNMRDIEGIVLRGKWLSYEDREEGLNILMRKAVVSFETSGMREVNRR